MKLNRIAQRGKPSPIHSSGIVQGRQMGSASAESFSQRLQRDRSRQLIGGYRDAKLVRQPKEDHQEILSNSRIDRASRYKNSNEPSNGDRAHNASGRPLPSSRIDIVRPTGPAGAGPSGSMRATPQQHVFREPPSRHGS